jgi:hypothetical protein
MNSTGIELAIGVPWPLPTASRTKTRKKRKEVGRESIILKYPK